MSKVRMLATSKWMDFLGLAIVILVAILSGYLKETLADVTNWGPWTAFVPFGIISIFNSGLSIMSTRFTGRMENLGNIIGLINTVLSGVIDYILGNKAAIITYPVTFIIYTFAINKWLKSAKYQSSKPLVGISGNLAMIGILIVAMVFSYLTNLIGWSDGYHQPLFWIVVIAFGLSLASNVLNAMKLTVQWKFWLVYNFVQLIKALLQLNWANVGKYIYYIINSIAALSFWNQPIEEK